MKKIKDKKIGTKENKIQDELILPNDHYYLKNFFLFLLVIVIIGGLIYGSKIYFYDNPQYGFNKYFDKINQDLIDDYHHNYHDEDKLDYLLTISGNQQNDISNYINKTTFQGSIVYKDKQFINYVNTKYNDDINNCLVISTYENKQFKNQISIINHEFTFNNTTDLDFDFVSLFKNKYEIKKDIGNYTLERNNKVNEYRLKLSKDDLNKMFNNELLNSYFGDEITITIKTTGLILEEINSLTIQDEKQKIELDLINDIYKYESDKTNVELDKKDLLNWHIKINNNDYLLRGDIILSKSTVDDYIILNAYKKKINELKVDDDLLAFIKEIME